MNYSTEVKQKLLSIITKMDSYYWLFTKHPKTDFSRKKKWSFEILVYTIFKADESICLFVVQIYYVKSVIRQKYSR